MNRLWLTAVLVIVLVFRGVVSNNRCVGVPDGVFINDFTACNAFYTCFRGEAFPGTCVEPFYFNEEQQLCDHPWQVKCLICPETEDLVPSFVPIEGECTYYALCIQGIGTLRECAKGLEFNAAEGFCDLPENAQCETGLCPSNVNPSVPTSVPHPSDCSKFYICLYNEATEQQCAPTLLFNPETRFCDLEENVECQEGVPSPTACPPTGIHLIGNPADCVSFFVCLNGEKSDEATNCAPELIFDITDSVCRPPNAESRCANGEDPLPPVLPGLFVYTLMFTFVMAANAQRNPCLGVPDGMFVNDFTSCESYFLCLGGVSTQAQCPPGFYFNEAQQLCDFPQNVFCHVCNQQIGVQLSPHPTNCDQFITCSNGISFVGNCKSGETFDVALQACKSEIRVDCERLRCPEIDNPNVVVFIPGFQSCDEYFLCQAGTPIQRFCAPGLHWNRVVERCDFPELAQCP
uniref:Chitin-binding type-2 domain-containing protein n=1 Tax=Anopheles minimus TaxID=112268 RepID=A0A182W3W3_9DIPT